MNTNLLNAFYTSFLLTDLLSNPSVNSSPCVLISTEILVYERICAGGVSETGQTTKRTSPASLEDHPIFPPKENTTNQPTNPLNEDTISGHFCLFCLLLFYEENLPRVQNKWLLCSMHMVLILRKFCNFSKLLL